MVLLASDLHSEPLGAEGYYKDACIVAIAMSLLHFK